MTTLAVLMTVSIALALLAAICTLVVIFSAKTPVAKASRWRRVLIINGVTGGVGLAGLIVGALRYPESNLLGGFALVFGPLYMVGVPAVVILLLARWIATRRPSV